MEGKFAVLDITESGGKIGEKLFAILDAQRQQELIQYVLANRAVCNLGTFQCSPPPSPAPRPDSVEHLTERRVGELYFCLESRTVCISGKEIDLTAREFDIFALLIGNPKRVFSYEAIMSMVWHEPFDYLSKKTVSNHVSNLRLKLNTFPHAHEYIKCIRSVGYKFNTDIL